MAVNYEMQGNYVMRDGEAVALITPNGGIEFPDDEARKFANVVTKFLSGINRYDRETGIAVFQVDGADAPPVPGAEFDEEEVNTEKLNEEKEPAAPPVPAAAAGGGGSLTSIRMLIDVMQGHCPDDPCPPYSPMWGEETPAVQEWLARHRQIIETVRQVYRFTGSLEYFTV